MRKENNNKDWNLKKYLILFICLILFYIILIPTAVSASEPITLSVGVYENQPKIFTDDKGSASGFWPDIINYIALKEGWKIEWVRGTWAQCSERLENGEIDLMPDVSFTEPRSKKYAFSRETVLVSWTRIYARKGAGIQSILDLEGKKIGVMTGSVNFTGTGGIKELIDKFDFNCTFVETDNYSEVFELLKKREVDAGVTNKDFGNKHEKDFDIDRTPIIFRPSHLQFAFPLDSSLTPHLLERIDYHIKELKEDKDSIYYQSLENWLTVKVDEKQVTPVWLYYILIGIGGIALLLFGGNFILRSQVRFKTKELREDITQRKKAEESLRQSERRYRFLAEQPGQMIYDYNILSGKINWSGDIEGVTGFNFDYFRKVDIASWRNLIHADNRKNALALLDNAMKNGKKYNIDYRLKCKDGTYKFIEDNGFFLLDKNGKAYQILGIMKDISKRKESEEKLKKTMDATIETMSKIIEIRDPYTSGHQQGVSQLASAIAKELNLSPDNIEGIRIASLIHDIGKISIPTEILSKSTTLSDLEFSLIKEHSQTGYNILKSIVFSFPVAQIVLQHHERINGSGYPNKLNGDKILLEAKIIGVADVVEAMSSHRPYRPALGIDAALEEITQNRGILYDTKVVDTCLKLFKEKGFKFK